MNQQEITDLRLEVDVLINSTNSHYFKMSREISLAFTSLQRTKAHLGKVMGELGSQTPYVNSENPANSIIEPQADHVLVTLDDDFQKLFEENEEANQQIARVKLLRSKCQSIADKLSIIIDQLHFKDRPVAWKLDTHAKTAYVSICDSKMWFGWELDRIR